MATNHLALIKDDLPSDVRAIRNNLIHLRKQVEEKVGEHDGIDIRLAKDLSSIEVTIYLKTDRAGEEASFLLKHAEFPEMVFTGVEVRPVPNKAHRKLIFSRVIHPSEQ